MAALCVWLHGVVSEDLVLVLDDLHLLPPDSDAAAVVANLCQYQIRRSHLVSCQLCSALRNTHHARFFPEGRQPFDQTELDPREIPNIEKVKQADR